MLSHGAWEMMQSVWPVHGSVLVENGIVSCVAGHSCFLDGGLWFYRLDAKTGEMRVKQNYDDKAPDTSGDLHDRQKSLQMPVALNNILYSDHKIVTIVSAEALTEDWHHLVGTRAAVKKMRLYIDGKLVAEGSSDPSYRQTRPAHVSRQWRRSRRSAAAF
jgi:hypothetical protein